MATERDQDTGTEPPAESGGEDARADGSAEGAGAEDTAAPEADEDRLTEEIREELQELEELRDRHLRLAAEFDNYKKRTRRQMVEQRDRAQADLAREILEVLDDLARVASSDPDATSPEALHEGVEMVERKLRKKLGDAGVHRIEAAGRPFDPEVHDALASVPTDDPEEDGVVAEVIAEGYRHGDRLLRPAQVAVKQHEG
jgi:molecular chaperone GrpE